MRPQACQILHRVGWGASLLLRDALPLRTVASARRRWWPQNDVVVRGLLLVPRLGVDLGETVLILVDLLQNRRLRVPWQAVRLLVGLRDLECCDVVGVLRAALYDHRVVSVLDLGHLLLVGAEDHVFLRVLLQVLVSLLDAASEVQVVGLALGALTVLSALVV